MEGQGGRMSGLKGRELHWPYAAKFKKKAVRRTRTSAMGLISKQLLMMGRPAGRRGRDPAGDLLRARVEGAEAHERSPMMDIDFRRRLGRAGAREVPAN